MITAFPPRILICIDSKYEKNYGFLHEDAMQLMVDRLEADDPQGGWGMHDISEDEVVRADLVRSESGEEALYRFTWKGCTHDARIGQFDRTGKAEVFSLT
ncbi:MAG: hypothetical protein K5657_07045 [Desulfovibrio sp.]|nr:hypothetical protein [Desulfovibrio sp.]